MQALQNELFEELTAAVQEFGGFVDKFVGDALLALFGAPHAHEDDPERALRAALAMLERTARLDARWRGRAGLPLTLHLGVNTGPVVAGGFGAGTAKSYSVTGDTVNTAQRLQSLAGAGEVLVGPTTCRLARHAFGFESMGEVALKGKSCQLLVHRLIGPLEAAREARGLEALGLSAPLIGRDTELSRMLDCLERAVAGDAHVVRLIGDAGIGKSRLVSELLTRVEDDERFGSVVVRRTACRRKNKHPRCGSRRARKRRPPRARAASRPGARRGLFADPRPSARSVRPSSVFWITLPTSRAL